MERLAQLFAIVLIIALIGFLFSGVYGLATGNYNPDEYYLLIGYTIAGGIGTTVLFVFVVRGIITKANKSNKE